MATPARPNDAAAAAGAAGAAVPATSTMQTLKLLLILAYLAWCGGFKVGKFNGQWRGYLTKPIELLVCLIIWALVEWLIRIFSN